MWKAEKPVHILIHIGIIAGIIVTLAFLFFKVYLPFSTNHNEKIIVPVLTGKTLSNIEETLDDAGLEYHINDSTYVEGKGANIVLTQHPDAGSEVKKNRKIYITVSASVPPKVKMPKLTDQSLKAAELTLKSFDLKIGDVDYEDSPFKDLVLQQSINDQVISPGTYVGKGSKIDLKVGNGEGGGDVEVPYLIGMPKQEAISLLEDRGFKLGIVTEDTESTETIGSVSKQSPDPTTESKSLPKGSTINLWVAK